MSVEKNATAAGMIHRPCAGMPPGAGRLVEGYTTTLCSLRRYSNSLEPASLVIACQQLQRPRHLTTLHLAFDSSIGCPQSGQTQSPHGPAQRPAHSLSTAHACAAQTRPAQAHQHPLPHCLRLHTFYPRQRPTVPTPAPAARSEEGNCKKGTLKTC